MAPGIVKILIQFFLQSLSTSFSFFSFFRILSNEFSTKRCAKESWIQNQTCSIDLIRRRLNIICLCAIILSAFPLESSFDYAFLFKIPH
jgi:hypothetical protein